MAAPSLLLSLPPVSLLLDSSPGLPEGSCKKASMFTSHVLEPSNCWPSVLGCGPCWNVERKPYPWVQLDSPASLPTFCQPQILLCLPNVALQPDEWSSAKHAVSGLCFFTCFPWVWKCPLCLSTSQTLVGFPNSAMTKSLSYLNITPTRPWINLTSPPCLLLL